MKGLAGVPRPSIPADEIARLTYVDAVLWHDGPLIWVERGPDARLWLCELLEDRWEAGNWQHARLYMLTPPGTRETELFNEDLETADWYARAERHWIVRDMGKPNGRTSGTQYTRIELGQTHHHGPYRPA